MENGQSYGNSFGSTVGGTFASAVGRIVEFLPHLVAALVILAVGLVVAWSVALLTRKLLHGLGFDRFLEHHEVVRRPGQRQGSQVTGSIVYWVLALVTFVAAADALDLKWVTAGLARITSYLPNVLAALLIVVGAFILGNLAYRELASSRPTAPLTWPRIARASIYVLAGFMAIQELNIAVSIVTLCFGLLVGALAVAAAISFGIGNRQLAAEITREWYRRGRTHFGEEEASVEPEPRLPNETFPSPEPRH